VKFSARLLGTVAVLLGLTGIMLAALGSHLVDVNGVVNGAGIWQTASNIHLFQAAALLGMSAWLNTTDSRPLLWACGMMLAGAVLFCGSLYLKVASAGAFTGAAPLGGSIMMLGWLLAAIALWRQS